MTPQELLDLIAKYDTLVYGLLLTYAMGKTGPLPMIAGYLSFSGALDVMAVLATVAAGTLIGSQLRFWVGRNFAPLLYEKLPGLAPWLALGSAGVERYERLILPLYRFSKGTYTLIGIGAGASQLGWARFSAFDTLGAAAWTVSWVMIGVGIAAAGAQLDPQWAAYAGLAVLAAGLLLTAVLGRRLKRVLEPHASAALAAALARRQPSHVAG
jgi:membrane-associated protein